MPRTTAVVLAVVLLIVGIAAGFGIGFLVSAPTYTTSIQKIYATGVMVVGTDAAFPPFENLDPDTGAFEGFDIDLMKGIADFMGVRADFRNIAFSAIFAAVPARTIDIAISAMTINPERQQDMLFSDPYFRSNQTVIIRAGGPMVGNITSITDLAGKRVGYQEFTTAEAWVQDELIGVMGIMPSETRATLLYTDAIQLLIADEIDAVIIDSPVAESFEAAGSVVIVDRIPTDEQFGIPMALGEDVLKFLVDEALKSMMASGEFDRIFNIWFGAP